MNPLIVQILPTLITTLTKYGPEAYTAVVNLLHNSDPKLEDFLKLRDLATKTAADYVKEAQSA